MDRAIIITIAVVLVASAAHGETAKQLSDAGGIAYNLQRYTQALEDYRRAYELHQDPAILFNIGQCLRQLGQYDAAARSYRAYKSHAPPEAMAQVQRLIEQMDQASRQARAAMEAPPTAVDPRAELVAAPPPPKVPAYRKWWIWTAAGVVAAGAAVGLGVGLANNQRAPSAATGLGTIKW